LPKLVLVPGIVPVLVYYYYYLDNNNNSNRLMTSSVMETLQGSLSTATVTAKRCERDVGQKTHFMS